MKTKKLTYYTDLMPGWQDMQYPPYLQSVGNLTEKMEGNKRIKVTVELPVFGGTADVDGYADSASEEVESGFITQND